MKRNEWFLKDQPWNFLYSHPHNADTLSPQNHLLHTNSPKPAPNCSTRSTQNAP